MKRFVALLISLMLFCVLALPAAAKDLSDCEQAVLDSLKTEIKTVNGRVLLPSRDIAQMRKFFQNYEIGEESCDVMQEALDAIREVLGPLDFKSFGDIPADQREALRTQMHRIAQAMGASFESDGVRFRIVKDGAAVFEESLQVIVPVKPEENLGVSIAIVVLLVAGIGFAIVGSKKFEAGK